MYDAVAIFFTGTFAPDLFKLGVTLALGFLFGYERQKSRKPIGFGTFIFVSTGACSLGIIAARLPGQNTVPLLAAIVTGIGFLGAGALIKTGEKIHGFTSAALIWLFAIFGLAIGVGETGLGMIIYLIIWIVSLIDNLLQNRGIGAYKKQLRIVVSSEKVLGQPHQDVLNYLDSRLVSISVDREAATHTFTYDIALSGDASIDLLETLQKLPNVRRVDIE